MSSAMPSWLANVPLKTVGVLAAVHIFGKNIESRQIVLAGKRYFHNAVENVVNYVLNPILPPLDVPDDAPASIDPDADTALRNIRDCFNYIFFIQVEYFKILYRLMPEKFRLRDGSEFNLNRFSAQNPTLINSEKRYLILSRVDGAQPYDLDLDWSAEFDWQEDSVRETFRDRLRIAQEAYADTLALGEWYQSRNKNLIMPLRTIMDDLSEYFEHIGLAAYLMASNARRRTDEKVLGIRDSLFETCRHLERFAVDMMRMNVFSIAKHDLDRLGGADVDAVVRVRAEDEIRVGRHEFDRRREAYGNLLANLYRALGFSPSEWGTGH